MAFEAASAVGAAAAGYTLTVEIGRRGLVGAGGVFGLRPHTSCSRLGLHPPHPHGPSFANTTIKEQKQWPQKLIWQRYHLSAAVAAAGSSSIGSSIDSCGGIGCGGGSGSCSCGCSGSSGGSRSRSGGDGGRGSDDRSSRSRGLSYANTTIKKQKQRKQWQ